MATKVGTTFPRSGCPIACTLDLIGDKWSLVIVRDLLIGKRRFDAFKTSPEGIASNILSDRLRRLEEQGFVERKLYEDRPPRFEYVLTEKGLSLLPVLQEICRWANRFLPGTWVPPAAFMRRRLPKQRQADRRLK